MPWGHSARVPQLESLCASITEPAPHNEDPTQPERNKYFRRRNEFIRCNFLKKEEEGPNLGRLGEE